MPFDSDYKYLDNEYLYTDKDTGVLLNKQNIKDYAELVAFESLCVAKRAEQLLKKPIEIQYAYDLLKIHELLFQDVYYWAGNVRKVEIAKKLAEILDNLNFLHPFREGNGRTQREFIRLLALQKGFELNLNPIDNHSVYERYMQDTIDGNIDDLTDLIYGLLI